MMKKTFFIFVFAFFYDVLEAQNANDIIKEILQETAENDDEEFSASVENLGEYLERLSEDKISVNSCTFSDLQELPFLTDFQIQDILDYRFEVGEIFSLGELKGIESLNEKELNYLKYFLYVSDSELNEKENFSSANNSVTFVTKNVLEKPLAYYSPGEYQGNRFLMRLKYFSRPVKRVTFGFSSEKDPGEEIALGGKKYGFDFNSAFLKILGNGKLEKIIIGDYTLRFGLGLSLGCGFSSGKYISTGEDYGNSLTDLREYSSFSEYGFLRGAATSINLKALKITAFLSHNAVDVLGEKDSFYSFKTDGYHRNSKELDDKNSLKESVSGLTLNFRKRIFFFGLSGGYYCFDKSFQPKNDLVNLRDFSVKNGGFFSLNWGCSEKKYGISGELAFDKNFNPALITVLGFRPLAQLKMSVLYRNYSKRYFSFLANPFRESSKISNEEGCYLGLEFSMKRFWIFEAKTDIFSFPWPSFQTKKMSSGYDFSLQNTFLISKGFSATIRFKDKNKEFKERIFNRNSYLRFLLKYSSNDNFSMSEVLQWSYFETDELFEKGYLLSHSCLWNFQGLPLSLDLGCALFSAPYSAAIYDYETDVRGFYALQRYYYKGARYYAVLVFKPWKFMELQTKLSQWQYFDRKTLGSGKNKINSDKRTEISFYLRLKF